MVNKTVTVSIIILFLVSAVSPIVFGITIKTSNTEIPQSTTPNNKELTDNAWSMFQHDSRHTGRSEYNICNNPGDEKWKYYIEDAGLDHTAVIDNNGIIYSGGAGADLHAVYPNGTMKWITELPTPWPSEIALGDDNSLYVGTTRGFYGLYQNNGTLKWTLNTGGEKHFVGYPTIDSNGIIYTGTSDGYLYAIYPNGTIKWEYIKTGNVGPPAVDNLGNVYFTSRDRHLYCLNPDGSLKWKSREYSIFDNGPVIADDGTIIIAPRTDYAYAVYPNGTDKWVADLTDSEGMPSIAPDGTIIISGLHHDITALNPEDGNILWTYIFPSHFEWCTEAAISNDGIILFACPPFLYALNLDGSLRWKTPLTSDLPYADMHTMASPSISSDGTIYVVTWFIKEGTNPIYGYIHAFNWAELKADADGPHYELINEPVSFNGSATGGMRPYFWQWDFGDGNTSDEQDPIHIYSEPGNYSVTLTVNDNGSNISSDTTWVWVQDGNVPPTLPVIDGPTTGTVDEIYPYTFVSEDPEYIKIWYYVDWGDGDISGWIGPYVSGMEITLKNRWLDVGTFTIRCKAKDIYGLESDWGELEVNMPRNKNMMSSLFLSFLKQFPILQRLFFSL